VKSDARDDGLEGRDRAKEDQGGGTTPVPVDLIWKRNPKKEGLKREKSMAESQQRDGAFDWDG
jgi:hypothetical protein